MGAELSRCAPQEIHCGLWGQIEGFWGQLVSEDSGLPRLNPEPCPGSDTH